jgi:hypothetical protein
LIIALAVQTFTRSPFVLNQIAEPITFALRLLRRAGR